MPSCRVLITTPDLTLPGGVTGLLNLLRLDQLEGVEYFSVNFSTGKYSVLLLPIVYIKFFLTVGKFDTVHLNPSMNAKSFYRDTVFAFIAKAIFRKRLIVYWHGWQQDFFQKIKGSAARQRLFEHGFGIADAHLVLASEFSDQLKSIGCKGKILLESNVAEKAAIDQLPAKRNIKTWKILYLSRITKDKGWDLALATMKILQDRGARAIQLIVAGDGDCLSKAQDLARELELVNVDFVGYVQGEKKKDLLLKSDMLFFPTCYPEGMPVVILEGMMFGLPIITRKVGGIADHVYDGKNGYVTDSVDPGDFATFILNLTADEDRYDAIRQNNITRSREQFVPERLVAKLLSIYQ